MTTTEGSGWVVVFAGPSNTKHSTYCVRVRKGSRVTVHDGLNEAQYADLVANPRPDRSVANYANPVQAISALAAVA